MKRLPLIILALLVILEVACSDDVKSNDNIGVEKNSEFVTGISDEYKLKEILLFREGKLEKGIKSIPIELKGITNGMIIFNYTNVILIPASKYVSFDKATNSVVNKLDALLFVFSNLVIYRDDKDSNEEVLKDADISRYTLVTFMNHERSYIVKVADKKNNELYIVISEYKVEDEEFERAAISVWEDICWDRTVSVNITEKFANLIISKIKALKTNKVVYF